MVEQERPQRPWYFGLYPAATKKTGSYEEPPAFEPVERRANETEEQFEERRKAEQKRRPRPRRKKGGWCFAFPDVCRTPPKPPSLIPYPNYGFLKDAVACIGTVMVENKPVVVETSEIPTTTGDEPGRMGGMVSGTCGDKVTFLQYSSKVFAKGKAIVYLGCRTAQNNYNAIGKFEEPAQKKMWVAP